MEQKKILRIVFVAVFIVIMIGLLGYASHFIRSVLTQNAAQCDVASTVIVHNKTDQEVEIALRSKKEKRQSTIVPVNARGCFTLPNPASQLDSISITYNKRHYNFYDKEKLNSFEAPHYFAILILEKNDDPNRAAIQAKVERPLKERVRYMVLSAYKKLGAPLGDDAQLQVQKMR